MVVEHVGGMLQGWWWMGSGFEGCLTVFAWDVSGTYEAATGCSVAAPGRGVSSTAAFRGGFSGSEELGDGWCPAGFRGAGQVGWDKRARWARFRTTEKPGEVSGGVQQDRGREVVPL